MKPSALLTGYKTGTQLDWITYNLFFLFPLNQKQVDWLNTIIYKDRLFHINYWSFTHTLFGMIWGLLYKYVNPKWFNGRNYLIFHTLFEIWELYAIGGPLTVPEFVDIVIDTIFGYAGFYIIAKFLKFGDT